MDDQKTRIARAPAQGALIAVACLSLVGLTSLAQAALPPVEVEPPPLRACCALGTDLKFQLGPLETPLRIQSIADPKDLGRHTYRSRGLFDEKNGLIYTCRGGFIDLGHVRSAADLVAYLVGRLSLDREISFSTADGSTQVKLTSGSTLSASLAGRIAYDLTVVHEITTFGGGSTVEFIHEGYSAFSPEDLYSDLLGVHIARRALADPRPWNQAVDAAIDEALVDLEAVSSPATREALDQVADVWWSTKVKLPDSGLLLKRNFDFGPKIAPWLIPNPENLGCKTSTSVVLSVPLSETSTPGYGLNVDTAMGPIRPDEFAETIGAFRRQRHPQGSYRPTGRNNGRDVSPFDLRVVPVKFFVGGTSDREPVVGMSVVGGQAKSPGGDISAVQLTLSRTPDRGLVTHIVGLAADRLLFCRSKQHGDWVVPVSAWFSDCEPGGILGVGADLLTVRHDGRTSRLAVRPVSVAVSADLLQTAFTEKWAQRRLGIELQAAVETDEPEPNAAEALFWAEATVFSRFATDNQAWSIESELTFHQEATQTSRRALTGRVLAGHRLNSGAFQWDLGVELGAARRWSHAQPILHYLAPVDLTMETGGYGLLTFGMSLNELAF